LRSFFFAVFFATIAFFAVKKSFVTAKTAKAAKKTCGFLFPFPWV